MVVGLKRFGWLKPAVFLLSLVPCVWLVWNAFTGGLGVNPIEEITHRTGDWTLRFLLLTLAMTPLRRVFGWGWPLRIRRLLGLYAFFYASLHLVTYLWFDQFFVWSEILADIAKRPFITVGMLAFVAMLPLALTSTNGMMRRLGRHWKQLHRLVYPVAILGVVHFWWLVKADIREPAVYAAVLAVLLGYRAMAAWRRRADARRGEAERTLST